MRIFYRCSLIVLLLVIILFSYVNVYSCGPFFPTTVFVKTWSPDYDITSFVQGNLGIVQPEYSDLCRFVTYRYLSQRPLSASEQAIVNSVIAHRSSTDKPPNASDEWLAARYPVLGYSSGMYYATEADVHDTSTGFYTFYININEDAFRTATRTLRQRIEQFGPQSRHVVDWVHAQDDVFYSAKTGKLPHGLDPGAPAIFQADRAYQIAAAHFYLRHYDIAESQFNTIANDSSSPWRQTSKFLIARCLIRRATLLARDQDSQLQKAEAYLRTLLDDPMMKEFHPAAQRLLSFCMFRTHTEEYFGRLDHSIADTTLGPRFATDVGDYILLLNRYRGKSSVKRSDFADWNASVWNRRPADAFKHAYARWMKTRSQAWLVAALSVAGPTTPELPKLFAAAAAVPARAPGYATANFLRLRLQIERKENNPAKKLIDALLANRAVRRSVSNTNLVLAQRLRLVESFEEFLRYCHQRPCGITFDDDYGLQPAGTQELFTPDASILNRRVPLRLLQAACSSLFVPENLRFSLLRATWVRSFLLEEDSVALALRTDLGMMSPQLKPFLDRYGSAEDEDSRRFAGAFMLLKFPGLRPSIRVGVERSTPLGKKDDLRDNWWYTNDLAVDASAEAIYARGYSEHRLDKSESVSPSVFLAESDRQAAQNQIEKLSSLPAAATYLGMITTEWAKAHPQDPRVPEALHITVQVSRVGCTDSMSAKFSKRAFTILHRQYPKSEWTKKAKYWY